MTEPFVFTHCGKLGDFIATLPISSWLFQTRGIKTHFVLPNSFPPFNKVESLLKLQPFTDQVTLVDYKVQNYWCGGQPYHFNPNDYGVSCGNRYLNLGFRGGPNKPIWQFVAEEYGIGWDEEFRLELGIKDELLGKYDIKAASDSWITEDVEGSVCVIKEEDDILLNVKRLIYAKESYVSQSGPFHIMDMAGYLPTELLIYPHQANLQLFSKNLDKLNIRKINKKVL